MWPISVFILAANDIMALNCRKALCGEEDISIIGQTKNVYEAVKEVKELKPRILLLDVNLLGFNHAEFVQCICHHSPKTCIVLLTYKTTPDLQIIEALTNGALGYIEVSLLPSSLSKAIRRIDAGEGWISRKFLNVILEHLFTSPYPHQTKYTH
jgi:DNA-binding NarL/FixJ family response regulator